MIVLPARRCKTPGCPFDTTGECLEGFAGSEITKKCHNFDANAVKKQNTKAKSAKKTQGQNSNAYVELPSGKALRKEDIYQIAAEHPPKIILCAGPPASGKSTFMTSFYEEFRRGSFGKLIFSGSKTILGFEERCHPSRIDSNRDSPYTDRTQIEADGIILHLKLVSKGSNNPKHDLLFVDVSGELFDAARNSSEDANRIPLAKSANFFVLFFDGQKLTDLKYRQHEKQCGLDLLRSCQEQMILGLDTNVQIVVSKKDVINKSENMDATIQFIGAFLDEIKDQYAKYFRSLTTHLIAARPIEDDQLKNAYGMDEIIVEWTQVPSIQNQNRNYEIAEGEKLRNIDAFTFTETMIGTKTS